MVKMTTIIGTKNNVVVLASRLKHLCVVLILNTLKSLVDYQLQVDKGKS